MTIEGYSEKIRQWWDDPKGWCYVASEALYYLMGGKGAGLKPMQGKVGDISHWWLVDTDGNVIDLTADQFDFPWPYEQGVGRGFMPNMKNDTRELIEWVENG